MGIISIPQLSASNISGTSKYSQTVSYKTLPKVPTKIDKPRLVGKAKTQSFTVCWGKKLSSWLKGCVMRYLDCLLLRVSVVLSFFCLLQKSQPVLFSSFRNPQNEILSSFLYESVKSYHRHDRSTTIMTDRSPP